MSARHLVLWTADGRTHVASRHAYRRGEASWRHDETPTVPGELVDALGWWEWQTPINGPFPAFSAEALPAMIEWLTTNGYTAQVVAEPRQ